MGGRASRNTSSGSGLAAALGSGTAGPPRCPSLALSSSGHWKPQQPSSSHTTSSSTPMQAAMGLVTNSPGCTELGSGVVGSASDAALLAVAAAAGILPPCAPLSYESHASHTPGPLPAAVQGASPSAAAALLGQQHQNLTATGSSLGTLPNGSRALSAPAWADASSCVPAPDSQLAWDWHQQAQGCTRVQPLSSRAGCLASGVPVGPAEALANAATATLAGDRSASASLYVKGLPPGRCFWLSSTCLRASPTGR
jgi:hypothetical protein